MTNQVASLTRLHDIIGPSPAPLWPPAPGWWVLAGIILTGALLAALLMRQRHRANRYRREALAELARTDSVPEIARLLKRVALTVWPRREIASLQGEAWLSWLRQHGGEAPAPGVAELLRDTMYRPSPPPPASLEALRAYAGAWIRDHRREPET